MKLDYIPGTGNFVVTVPRSDCVNIRTLMQDYGLDFSTSASTSATAVLFTQEPYAAASFGEHATPAARGQLKGILDAIDSSWKSTSTAHFACPADQELWDFQKADLEYALRRRNTLVGDQPGLGKTPTAICFANEIRAKRVLVVCPAAIRLQWVKRIREWTTMPWPLVVHPILSGRNGVHPSAQWTVVSYDLARTPPIWQALLRGSYDLLILDEAHYLKSHDAERTRAVFGGYKDGSINPIASRAAAVLALTGTPLPNRPREAYTICRGMCFDSIDWLSEDAFKRRFNPSLRVDGQRADGSAFTYIDERSGRHAELQNRLRGNFMVRHLKRDVMPQLKLPVYDIIQLDETGAVKEALAAESLLHIDPEHLEGADAEVLGHIAVVRRMMGVALAPQVADYVEMLIDGGEDKLVLFGWHHEVLDILQRRLEEYGVVRIDGRTTAQQKERYVQQFVDDPRIDVCLGNIQSMGVGTDGLQQVSCHALIAEPSWTPGDNVQAFDRLDRGGQRRQVQGDIFVAPGSFAERILATSLRKLQTTHKALDRRVQ